MSLTNFQCVSVDLEVGGTLSCFLHLADRWRKDNRKVMDADNSACNLWSVDQQSTVKDQRLRTHAVGWIPNESNFVGTVFYYRPTCRMSSCVWSAEKDTDSVHAWVDSSTHRRMHQESDSQSCVLPDSRRLTDCQHNSGSLLVINSHPVDQLPVYEITFWKLD
jgi:hypothetical protein